jgi:hypothetical protein
MLRFLRSTRLTNRVANVQPRPHTIQRSKSETKPPIFQIDYATWHTRLSGC